MGSLVPGWDSGYDKPRGIEEFDEVLDEPNTAGSNYQRQLLRKYSSKASAPLAPGSYVKPHPKAERDLEHAPTFQRQGSLRMPQRTSSLDRHSLDAVESPTYGSLKGAGGLFRRSAQHPATPRSEGDVEQEQGEETVERKDSWWGRFDSSYLNRQVEPGDEDYRSGSFKPQYDVAGQPVQYKMDTKPQGGIEKSES